MEDRHRCRGRRGRLRRRRSTQSSPRRQWRRREAAEEKGGSELRVSATTRLTEDWEAATEEAFAREGGTSGGRRRLPGHGDSRERRRSRRRQPTMLGVDAGETEEKRPSGNRERRSRWLGLCVVEKETVEKEEADVDGCDGELGSKGALMKTETRLTATEKSEGREDPHVVGEGKEEEGERDSGGDEVCRGYGDSITEEKGSGVCGGGREGRKGRHGGGRGRRGRRDRGVAGGREGEEGGEAGADGEQREEQRQTATFGVKERRRWSSAR